MKLSTKGLILMAMVFALAFTLTTDTRADEDGDRDFRRGDRERPMMREGDRDRPMMRESNREGMPGRGPMDEADRPPLTEEQIEQAIEILKIEQPDLARRIEQAKNRDPRQVGRLLRPYAPRIMMLAKVREEDPEMFELLIEDARLGREANEIAKVIKQVRRERNEVDDDDDRGRDDDQDDEKQLKELNAELKDLTTELENIVEEHFNVRQEMRERRLMKLEQQIDQLHQQLEQREDHRRELIEQRIDELLGQESRPQW